MRVTKNRREFSVVEDQWEKWWQSAWEWETFNLLDKLLTKDMSLIDIGAWIGPVTLYAAGLCNKVYSIEPDPVAFDKLRANIAANGFTNVDLFNQAIMHYDGSVCLGAKDLGESVTRVGDASNRIVVGCKTLEAFSTDHLVTDPLFIKMDCEGAEELILLHSVDFFRVRKPILYVSTHPGWFLDLDSGVAVVRRVGRLYRHQYDAYLQPVDIETVDINGAFVFMD